MASGMPIAINILEAAIMYLLSEGYIEKEIAEKLCTCPDNVHKKVMTMYDKTQLRRRTQAALVSLGHDSGLIHDVREHIKRESGFYGYKVIHPKPSEG
jgi:DNA-binding CsgD family transcriptional regulator